MAVCPFADHKWLPENAVQSRITPRCVIAHSAGGEAELYGWWMNDQSRGLESHFWVGRDGRIVQYIDSEVRADANGEANGYAVSIETQSTVHASEPWDPPQLAAITRLVRWLCDTHDIPAREMPTPTSAGLGHHVLFGAPGPWTRSAGKVCPGPARIRQWREQVIPAVARSPITPPAPPKGFLMALSDAEQDELLIKVRAIHKEQKGHGDALRQIRAWVRTVAELVAGKKSPAELAARAQELND